MNCRCMNLEVINEVTISVNPIPSSHSITHTMYHIKLHKGTKLHNKLLSPSNSIKSLQLLLDKIAYRHGAGTHTETIH